MSIQVHATHIMGADITYTYIGTNSLGQMKYFVRLSFYRDCCNGCSVSGPAPSLILLDSCTGATHTYNMGVDSCPNGCEVTTLCPGVQNSCDLLSSTFPGVEKYIDTATVTLTSACAKWVVSWTDGNRNATISNLQNPNGQFIYIQATINNSIDPSTGSSYINSSVFFTKNPVPFACLTNAGNTTYSNGAVDPNGDSLVYTLTNPLTAANTPIPHTAGYTSTAPIKSNPPVTFDGTTGIMGYNPIQQEIDVITFLVQEYRHGVLVGSVMRDVQLTIVPCSLPTPPADGNPINLVNADTAGNNIKICPGTPSSFDIFFKDPNGRHVTLTSDITGSPSALPGATFAQIGTGDSVIAHITWTATPGDTGCHPFEINVATNDCPIPGTSVKSFSVCVLTKVTVTPHYAIYCGTPIKLVATGGSNATWTPTTGLTFPTSIYEPLAAPSVNTFYTFTSDCGSDTTRIIYNPPFRMSAGTGGTICQNNILELSGTVDSLYAPYKIEWIPASGLTNPLTNTPDDTILNPEASPSQTTNYTLQITANTGCVRTDQVTVTVNGQAPAITAHANPDTVCPGQPVTLWVTDDPACGLSTTPCQGSSTRIQVGSAITQQGGPASLYPSPYGNYLKSARHQMLFHANELYALLGSGGQITAIAMDIGILESGSILNNFTIRIGCVPDDSLTGYVDESLLSTVYVSNYTPVTQWNTHVLQTPYNWDGQSNLVVDFCFINNTNLNINNKMVYTATPFRSYWFTNTDAPTGACGFSGGSPNIPAPTCYQRPNFRFTVCRPQLTPITWTPSTGPDAVTLPHADTTFSHPVNQTTYYVTLNDTNGCSSRSFVTVFVDTAVELSVIPDTFICTVSPVKLLAKVTVATGNIINANTVMYSWTTRPATSPAPPSGIGPGFANPTVTPSVTTTYICTISGPGLCNITDSAVVTLGTGLPVVKIVDSITCPGANNGKIIITMNAGTPPYRYTWTPAATNTDSIVNLAPGTYSVIVKDTAGCVGKDTTKLVAPTPLALTFDSANIKCYNVDIDTIKALVTGGRQPYRYTWLPAATNTAILTNVPTRNYQLTVTDTSGCTISGAVNITQPPLLTSIAIVNSLSGNNTHDGTITVTANGGTPGYTYSSVPAATGLPNATHLDTGIYHITICDANHCCTYDTVYVSEPPPIFITFTTVNNLCHTDSAGSAYVSARGGVPPYTYIWNTVPPTVVISTGDSIINQPAGTYRVEVTDSNNLHVFKDTVITSPPAVGMNIDSTPITCFNAANGQLYDSVYGGVAPYTIIWNPGGGANPLTGLSPNMYVVNVTDANGCPAADTAYLGQPLPLTADTLSTDSVKCSGTATGYANIAAIGGRRPYTYTWSGSSSVDSFAADLAAGSQSVIVTDHALCTTTVTFTIYQPAMLSITAVDTTHTHCAASHDGTAMALVAGGSPGYTYSWDGTTGGSTIAALAAGSHTLIVTDSKGCPATQTFAIDTEYALHISLTTDSVSCNGGNDGKVFAAVLNGYAVYSYSWSPASSGTDSATGLNAGTQHVTVTDKYGCNTAGSIDVGQPNAITDVVSFANPLCASQQNGKVWVSAGGTTGPYTYLFNGTIHHITDTVFNLAEGTYQFTVYDGRNCSKQDAVTLSDPLQLKVPVPAVTNITCANESNGGIQVSPTGGTRPYSYLWTPGSYTASQESTLGPATYDIKVTDANGCEVTVSVVLTAPPYITFDYIESDSVSCPDSADGHIVINVVGGTAGDLVPYTYSIDGINYFPNHNFYNLQAGSYTIYAKDSEGCIADTIVPVYQPLPVTASINPQDSIIALGSSLQLFTVINNVTTQAINSYAWSPAMGLNCLDCPNPISSPYQTTNYLLTVNYGKNCLTTASNTVGVGPPPDAYIPNAFTPNGDNVNDVFSIFGTRLQSVGMKVFNRWGEKVFDSGESQWASWDGTYRGVMQEPGVYVYYVQLVYLDGSKKYKEGSVTLIR